MTQLFLSMHREKKLSHFDLKGWVSGGIIIRPGKVSNWRIFESIAWTLNLESIWLSMLSQFDSQCWVNLTLNVESIWLSVLSQFDSQCWVNLTLNVEPIWLSMLSQLDSQCWVNSTLNVESIWLKYSPVTHFAGSNFISASDSTLYVKWLYFFLSVYQRIRSTDITILNWTTLRLNQSIKISALVYIYISNIY